MENFLPSMPGTPAPVDKEILTQIYEDPRRKNFFRVCEYRNLHLAYCVGVTPWSGLAPREAGTWMLASSEPRLVYTVSS